MRYWQIGVCFKQWGAVDWNEILTNKRTFYKWEHECYANCQALVPSPILLDPKPTPKQSQKSKSNWDWGYTKIPWATTHHKLGGLSIAVSPDSKYIRKHVNLIQTYNSLLWSRVTPRKSKIPFRGLGSLHENQKSPFVKCTPRNSKITFHGVG